MWFNELFGFVLSFYTYYNSYNSTRVIVSFKGFFNGVLEDLKIKLNTDTRSKLLRLYFKEYSNGVKFICEKADDNSATDNITSTLESQVKTGIKIDPTKSNNYTIIATTSEIVGYINFIEIGRISISGITGFNSSSNYRDGHTISSKLDTQYPIVSKPGCAECLDVWFDTNLTINEVKKSVEYE